MSLSPEATLTRRALAMLYDSVALIGVLAAGALVALPLNDGDAITSGNLLFQLWLLALLYAYFVFSWRRGGQTLGMRAWKVRVVDTDGSLAGWGKLTLRFALSALSWAVLGLGFIVAFRRPHQAWHDRWSQTRFESTVSA